MPNKILLVDDDREFRAEFRECFEEYNFVEAANGEDALNILKRPNEIDLVILDVNMPGIKGTEVLKEIKDIAPDLGIIILTGHSSEDVAIEAIKGHADDYLEKPINIDNTREIIDGLLEARAGKGAAAGSMDNKVEKVKRFVDRNCYKKVSLKEAADAVALSPKYLSRIFKEDTGTGFNEYRLSIKLREAKALLKETRLNIDQISYKLGYQNTESFIRLFKEFTGKTPTEYRRKSGDKRRPAKKRR